MSCGKVVWPGKGSGNRDGPGIGGGMLMRWFLAAALAFLAAPVLGDTAGDEAAIRARLLGWAVAFNAGDAEAVCDLFAEDLVSVVAGAPDAGKAAVCARLARIFVQDETTMRYAADIDEIFVWGDHAAVRLDWALTIEAGGETITSVERGLDLFRRDPDGVWRIMRFMAFTEDDGAHIDPRAGHP